MSESQEETPEGLGFRRLSSDDILKERGHSSNGHSERAIPTAGAMEPTCAVCRDTRWLASAPSATGRSPTLVPCVCQNAERDQAHRLKTYATLGNLSDRTFKTLRPRWRRGTADPDSMERAVKTAKEYAKEPSGWLVVSGPLRTGKSHIAAAITNQCATRGTPTKFVSAMDIAEVVKDLDSWSDSEDAQSKWEAFINAPILIIDDVGMQLSNARVLERLDQLLSVRSSIPSPTVIVLARPSDELPDRIAQRLNDERLCKRIEILPRHSTDTSAGRVHKAMLERMTFDNFKTSGVPDATQNDHESLSLALDAAEKFPNQPTKWVHFHGPSGVGKTHLAVAIAGRALSNGTTPTYWRVPELLDKLRDSFSDRSWESFDERLRSVKNSELLILDDFCPPTMTDWTLEKLYQVVCHRYDMLLPTVTTSQFVFWDPENIERFSRLKGHYERQITDYCDLERKLLWNMIMSRMQDGHVVMERLMSAPDYRKHYRGREE